MSVSMYVCSPLPVFFPAILNALRARQNFSHLAGPPTVNRVSAAVTNPLAKAALSFPCSEKKEKGSPKTVSPTAASPDSPKWKTRSGMYRSLHSALAGWRPYYEPPVAHDSRSVGSFFNEMTTMNDSERGPGPSAYRHLLDLISHAASRQPVAEPHAPASPSLDRPSLKKPSTALSSNLK